MRVTAPATPIPAGTDATLSSVSTPTPITSSPPPADGTIQTTQESTPVSSLSSLPTSTPPLIQSTSTSSIPLPLKRESSDIIDDNPKRQRIDDTSHLQPPTSTSTTSPNKVKKKKRPLSPQDPNAPPRRIGTKQAKLKKPLAPFHLYAHAVRALGPIKDEHGNIITDEKAATKVISTRWKALSRADKQIYKAQYDQEMITYTETLKKQDEEAVAAFQSGKSTPGAVAAGKEALAQYLSSKAENETTSTRTLLPLSAVRKLLQNDTSLAPLSREAASVVTRCSEEFARWMSKRIFECAWVGGRKILRMQDFELALASQECLRFARHTMFARPPGAAHDKLYEDEFPDDEMGIDEGDANVTRTTSAPTTTGTGITTGIEPGEVIVNDTARTQAEVEADADADAEADAMEDDGDGDADAAVDPDAEGDGDQDGGDGDGDGDGDDGDEPEGGEENAATAAAGDGSVSPPSNAAVTVTATATATAIAAPAAAS